MGAVRFTETMTGFVAPDAVDPATGYASGRRAGRACTFRLTIVIPDVAAHLADDDTWATATGWIDGEQFGGRQPVVDGRFRLFDPVADPRRRAMRYRLPFHDCAGRPLELVGKKDVGDDPGIDVWSDTTRLSVEIRRGHDTGELEASGVEVVARGILVIKPLDLLKQLSTFRGPPASVAAFLWAFGATLTRLYRRRSARRTP